MVETSASIAPAARIRKPGALCRANDPKQAGVSTRVVRQRGGLGMDDVHDMRKFRPLSSITPGFGGEVGRRNANAEIGSRLRFRRGPRSATHVGRTATAALERREAVTGSFRSVGDRRSTLARSPGASTPPTRSARQSSSATHARPFDRACVRRRSDVPAGPNPRENRAQLAAESRIPVTVDLLTQDVFQSLSPPKAVR